MVQRSVFVLGQPIASSSSGASGCNWGIRLQLGHPVATGTFRRVFSIPGVGSFFLINPGLSVVPKRIEYIWEIDKISFYFFSICHINSIE